MYINTELALPMYNVHPYFSLKTLVKTVCVIRGNMQSFFLQILGNKVSSLSRLGHNELSLDPPPNTYYRMEVLSTKILNS